jgi:hypothetical protein
VTDALFNIAQMTKASIHSTVGDRVQLSWNATHRVAQPEVKAATFLLKLRETFRSKMSEGYTLAGACCSGLAEVHSVFSAATKQQALYIDAPWLPLLECCYNLATKHQALIIDSNTAAGAHYDVVAQAVDCIRYKPRVALLEDGVTPATKAGKGGKHEPQGLPLGYRMAPFPVNGNGGDHESLMSDVGASAFRHMALTNDSNSLANPLKVDPPPAGAAAPHLCAAYAFELLSLKEMAEDEWMYQLKEAEGKVSPAEATTAALQLAVQGRFGEAVEALERAEKMCAEDSRRNKKENPTTVNNLTQDEGSLRDTLSAFCHEALVNPGGSGVHCSGARCNTPLSGRKL